MKKTIRTAYRYRVKIFSTFLGLCFTFNICLSQFQEVLIESKFNSTCYIQTENTKTHEIDGVVYDLYLVNGKNSKPFQEKLTGSGFIVKRVLDYYLITATHVATTTKLSTLIAIGNNKGQSSIHSIRSLRFDNNTDWVHHELGDVSALRLNLNVIKSDSVFVAYPIELISTLPPPRSRSLEVTVFGFPLGLGVNIDNIEPISKTSRISSGELNLNRFDNKVISPMYLLDDPSTSGFSGGPVFITDEKYHYSELKSKKLNPVDLIGVVHGTISDGTGGKFCAVTPSKLIVEIIEAAGGFSGLKEFHYLTGEKWAAIDFVDGAPYNVLYNFDKNGMEQESGTLKNGTGLLILYDENGKISSENEYKNGHLQKSKLHFRFISTNQKEK